MPGDQGNLQIANIAAVDEASEAWSSRNGISLHAVM